MLHRVWRDFLELLLRDVVLVVQLDSHYSVLRVLVAEWLLLLAESIVVIRAFMGSATGAKSWATAVLEIIHAGAAIPKVICFWLRSPIVHVCAFWM